MGLLRIYARCNWSLRIWAWISLISKKFAKLPADMILKFGDGWLNGQEPLGYPDWWLKAVGYEQGPPPPPKPHGVDEAVDLADVLSERCVAGCPSKGFAACAQGCLAQSSPSNVPIVL